MTLDGILQIATAVGIIIVGVFALITHFSKARRDVENAQNAEEDRLIKLLKDEVDVLKRKVEGLESTVKENNQILVKLETENMLMKNILQGRDEDAIKIRAEYRKSALLIEETHKIVKLNQEAITKLYSAIEGHLKCLEDELKGGAETDGKRNKKSN